MKTSIKNLIERVKDLYVLLKHIDISLANPNISPGKKQSLIKDRDFKYKKIKSTLDDIKSLVNGHITTVRFENPITGEIYESTFLNLSDEDIALYLQFKAKISGKSIKILSMTKTDIINS